MKKPQDQITSKENPTKKIKKINVNSLQTLPENGRGGSTSKFTLRGQHFFLGSKIAADSDCNHEIKRCLLLGRKAMTNLDSILKSTLPTKVYIVKAMLFPVGIYRCESWTIRRLSTEELMLLSCDVGEDS